MICSLCDKAMETTDDRRRAYSEETGWAKPRQQGGTNALAARKQTGRFAHPECVKALADGVDPAAQGQML